MAKEMKAREGRPQVISREPGKGRYQNAAKGKGDPRVAAQVESPVSRTIEKFSSNPFRDGGAQEQPLDGKREVGEPEGGPAGGRRIKRDPDVDKVTHGETGRDFGRTEAGSRVRPKYR